jgi:hypothetical protein
MGHKTVTHGGLTVALGNTKLGSIPNLSLPPGHSCPPNVPCRQDCYALRAYRQYPAVKACWERNWKHLQKSRHDYFIDLCCLLDKYQWPKFRYHVSGDIPSALYWAWMRWVALQFKHTQFLCFTKNFSLDFRGRPPNLTVVLSMWPGSPVPHKQLPRAWMQDGRETRVPTNAHQCGGSCEQCQKCFGLQNKQDVVFLKH